MPAQNKYKKNRATALDAVLLALMLVLALQIVVPLVHVLAMSLSTQKEYLDTPLLLMPMKPTLSAYDALFADGRIWIGYRSTLSLVALAVPLNLFLTTSLAYGLSRGHFPGRRLLMYMIVFTMLFQGGIIPLFLTMQSLGLYNSLWSLILNLMLSAYNVVIVRSYFSGLPVSIVESARIDGANDFIILFRLIIPLSKPVLATVALWVIVGHWNDYLNPLMFLSDRQNYTLQLILKELVLNAESSIHNISVATSGSTAGAAALGQQTRNAVLVVAMIPMVILYPFVQRYFVGGVTLGAVKE